MIQNFDVTIQIKLKLAKHLGKAGYYNWRIFHPEWGRSLTDDNP